MKRSLNAGEVIKLRSNGKSIEFTIKSVVGEGGSCIAYDVEYREGSDIIHRAILKEYCPAFLQNGENTVRENFSLLVPPEKKELFNNELERFCNTYKVINDYLAANLSASNYHTVQMGLYEGNGTFYTLTSKDYGKSYDKIEDNSLFDIIKLALSTTKAVEIYHQAGYVHLDIKPKNILILDGVTELIKLFDYDSLTSVEELKHRKVNAIPMPEDYYVPELSTGELRSIGIQTDIFEIGAMVFLRLFARGCSREEISYGSDFSLDKAPLAAGISPQAKFEIKTLLKRTLQISPRRRYQTTEELKAQLKKILSLLNSSTPYLTNLPKWQPSANCVGRQAEIKELKTMLDESGFAFVRAMGGAGKSELAKLFAQHYAAEYHTVQFCKYTDSLRNLIAAMPFSGLDECNYKNADDLIKEKNKLLRLCDKHTLIIIDNFNVTYDDFLRDFLPANNEGFKVIFTTRCTQAASYYIKNTYNLLPLSFDDCKSLFQKHTLSEITYEDEDVFEQLMQLIGYNTLVLTLIASTVKITNMDLTEIYSLISEQKLAHIDTEVFHEYDFDSQDASAYAEIYTHIKTVLSLSNLNDIQKTALKNLTLIPPSGIGTQDFIDYCDDERITRKLLKKLSDSGWAELTDENTFLHPIISDLIASDNEIKNDNSYYSLAAAIESYCTPDCASHISLAMNRLEFTLQLDKRYIKEPAEKRITVKIKLGRMYEDIYRPADARRNLKLAESLAFENKAEYFLPYIYHFIGSIEKKFGTITKAIEFFELSIKKAKNIKIRYYEIALDSMLEIADCYVENRNRSKAYEMYKKALSFARVHRIKEYIFDITDTLHEISSSMGLDGEAEKYKKIMLRYRKHSDESPGIPEFENINESMKKIDLDALSDSYSRYLSRMRDELGEESPVYKSLTNANFVTAVLNNNSAEAQREFAKVLNISEELYGSDSMETAKVLNMAVALILSKTDAEFFKNCATRAIDICQKNGQTNSYVMFEAKNALIIYCLISRKDKEANELIDSLDFSEFDDFDAVFNDTFVLARYLCDLGRLDESYKLAKKMLNSRTADLLVKSSAYETLALVSIYRSDYESAEFYLDQGQQITNEMSDNYIRKLHQGLLHKDRALIAFYTFDYKTALSETKTAVQYLEESDCQTTIFYQTYGQLGLMYLLNGDDKNAQKFFDTAERMLEENNFPIESYCLMYNNIATVYADRKNYEKAWYYFEKIMEARPDYASPLVLNDCLFCSNIGSFKIHIGEPEEGVRLIETAIGQYEALGCTDINNYFIALSTLADGYLKLEDYPAAVSVYDKMFLKIDSFCLNTNTEHNRLNFYLNYTLCLLELGENEKAYNFAIDYGEKLLRIFGSASPLYINTIIKAGGQFKAFGMFECEDFFLTALNAIRENDMEHSLSNAYLKNYIAVYFLDAEIDACEALEYLIQSKTLFEKLNATDDELYHTVLSNIEYAKEYNKISDKNIENTEV